jgi:hypothetical protein
LSTLDAFLEKIVEGCYRAKENVGVFHLECTNVIFEWLHLALEKYVDGEYSIRFMPPDFT